jgi:nicotinate-nucleotide--dimethylbenzimidazole phosphoribosyltransferase
VDLVSVGADIEWPDSEAGTAVRERLADSPDYGHLGALAEWWHAVRPHEALERPRGVFVGASVSEAVAGAADDVGASWRHVDSDGDVAAGAAVADDEIDAGADLLLVAAPGVDADAAIAVSVLTNTEPVKVLARGAAATDPEAWMERAIAVRDGRRACMPARSDPDRLLTQLGSGRLALIAGVVLRAAVRRTPVLLDGPVAAAGALIAYEAAPRAVRWWAAADLGADPVQELALSRMGQEAVLGLGSGLGDGLAALLTVPVIRAAAVLGS